VISQDPDPSTSVAPQTRVRIVVSRGPKPTVETPEVMTPEKPQATSRDINLKLTVPPGNDPQRIRIDVVDDNGEHTVVDGDYSPGDLIQQKVQVQGTGVSVRYYQDDQLLKEEIK
jgi:hypothetical protein